MLYIGQDIVKTIFVVAIATTVIPAHAQPSPLTLVPAPQQLELRAGATQLSGGWEVRIMADRPEAVGVDGLIADVRQAWGWSWRTGRGGGRHAVIVRPRASFRSKNPLVDAQGYDLRVERDSIVIAAPTETGRYYGVQTLRQLLRGSPSGTLRRMRIHDYPSLAWRGVSDDISRGQASTLDDFRATLEHLALYKINLYCLYLEDMARFWSAPEVGAERGALTPSELRLITQAARRHHITVMPIFQTLGHQERLLAHPAFRRHAEQQRPTGLAAWVQRGIWTFLPAIAQACGIQDPTEEVPRPTCFSMASPPPRRRVMELMDEVAAAVPSPFFHLGGDEPSDLGRGTSWRAIRRRGFGAVYADYMGALAAHVVAAQRRQPVVFGDVLLADSLAMSAMSREVAVMDWQYDPADSGASLRRLRRAGFRTVFASAGLWNWSAIYPDYGRAFPNVAHIARAAEREGAAGLVVSSWGDGGAESLRRANWAGYAYAADASWHCPAQPGTFLSRFVAVEYGGPSPGLARAERLIGWQAFPTPGNNQRLFHRRPRLRARDAAWTERMAHLEHDMTAARRLLAEAVPTLRFGRARVDVLDHAAARFQYAARRELVMERVTRRLSARPWASLNSAERSSDLSAIGALRDSSLALERRYGELWRRDSREPMLLPLLLRLRRQTTVLDTMMQQAREGGLHPEPIRAPASSS